MFSLKWTICSGEDNILFIQCFPAILLLSFLSFSQILLKVDEICIQHV